MLLATRGVDDDLDVEPWVRPLYFSFNLVGAACLILLLGTLIFSKRLHKQATLLSLCVAWIISSLGDSFLLFARRVTGPSPSHGVCLASASFVVGTGPMGALAALALVAQIWFVVTTPIRPLRIGCSETTRTALLVITPYIVGLGFIIATAVLGSIHPELVVRNKFYCVVNVGRLTDTSSYLIAVAMGITIILEIWIAVRLRSYFKILQSGSPIDVQLGLRVMLFGGYVLFALVAGCITIVDFTSLIPDMVVSTVSFAVFLIFGSQKDVLAAWGIGRSESRIVSPETTVPPRSRPQSHMKPPRIASPARVETRTVNRLDENDFIRSGEWDASVSVNAPDALPAEASGSQSSGEAKDVEMGSPCEIPVPTLPQSPPSARIHPSERVTRFA